MITSGLQPALPLAADGPALARVLRQTDLGRNCLIRITGPAALVAALWLCRHGYERAVYVHAKWVASPILADGLIVPHPCTADELAEILKDGDGVREGGVIVVQSAPETSDAALEGIPAVLKPRGYEVEHRLADKGRLVYVARRAGLGGFKQAA